MQSKSIVIENSEAESNSIVQADYCIIKKTIHINLEEAELS